MGNVVYVDVLLVVNFVIDYLLLLASGRLAGRTVRRGRLIASAIFGALTTLIIFVPRLPFWAMTSYKLGTALFMVLFAFVWRGGWQLLKDTLVFFTISFLLAGVMTAIWINFTPGGMLCFNGVVYFNVSMMTLLFTTVLAYLFLLVFSRIFKSRRPETERIAVEMVLGGKTVKLTAIEDTGNRLREPFSGSPVAVCGLQELLSTIPLQLIEGVLSGNFDRCCELDPRWQPRMIPYQAVGKSGVLAAIKPDEMVLLQDRERYAVEDVYLAISPKPVGDGDYQMLLSSELTKLKF